MQSSGYIAPMLIMAWGMRDSIWRRGIRCSRLFRAPLGGKEVFVGRDSCRWVEGGCLAGFGAGSMKWDYWWRA